MSQRLEVVEKNIAKVITGKKKDLGSRIEELGEEMRKLNFKKSAEMVKK